MRTPIAPQDAASQAATLKLHRPPNEPSDLAAPTDVRTTPVPVRTEGGFPRIRGYEILSVIGYGGMAIVYEARHLELNRRVAIKMLRGEALADPEYRERFRAEAEAIARVQHPNIIQVFEVGTIEAEFDELYPSPFLALEFVDGGSLTQHTYTPHPPREAAQLVETLAKAAHAAHELGVVHRDLKPQNVLLTRDGTPKIADFGIAKRIDAERSAADRSLTRDGTVMGTPEYMAPEMFRGNVATPTIDVYSLGVILYELLTGRVPFQGATFADTMVLALRQEPVPPRRLQPGVPRDLETICLKCLEKSPAKRYASAEELADDLGRWAAGRAIRARAVGPLGRTARWARRNPAVAVLTVAVHLVTLIGLAGIVWQWNDARKNAAEAHANYLKAETAAREAREAAAKERWERYRVSVFAASSALRLHDTASARLALDAAPDNHRDWVWHQLGAQLDRSREVLTGRGGDVGHARFTPDGRRVLLWENGRHLRVWDLPTRTELLPPPALSRGETRLSPDGATLAVRSDGPEVHLYDVGSWQVRLVLRGHAAIVGGVEFSVDGTRLGALTSDNTVRVWDTRTGEPVFTTRLPGGVSGPLVFSPNADVLATCRSGARDPYLFDVRTGRELARLDGHEGDLRFFLFSPTGDRIVSIEEFPTNVMRLWDAKSGQLLGTLKGHENQIHHVEFSRDGAWLVSASMDRTVRVWNLSALLVDGQLPVHRILRGHTERIEHAAFSPDGRRIVSASYDRTLRYWDVASGDPVAVLQGHTGWALRAGYSADQKTIYSASADRTLRVWDVAELDADYAIRGHANFVYSTAFHPDGERVVSAGWDGTARVWHATSGRELLQLTHTGPTVGSKIVSSAAYHPSGRSLATLSRDNLVRLWDGETGRELHRWPTASGHWCDGRLSFSPRGDLLAHGGADGRVRFWDVNTRAECGVLESHTAPIRDVAFSPDGALLATAGEFADPTIRVWEVPSAKPEGFVATRKPLQVLSGHGAGIYALAWNRAGTLLASGSLDNTVQLWDTATWKPVGEPLKQGGSAYGVAFAPDGKLLAVACADNLIRVWSVETRQVMAELSGHRNYVHSVAFSPDGKRLVSASGDKTIRIWDALSPKERLGR